MSNANNNADEFAQELQQLLYVISHDLAAPIRHVREFSKLLLASVETKTDDQQEYAQFVERALVILEQKLDAITALSRVATSAEPPTRVELNAVIETASSAVFEATASSPHVLRIAPGLPAVHARHSQLQTLLQALLSNAVIHHGADTELIIDVSATESYGTVSLRVSDNGPGIAPKHHTSVFELFRQLNPAKHPDGIGAGLTLARRIAQHHGGDITIAGETNQQGAGTTLIITLPAAQ